MDNKDNLEALTDPQHMAYFMMVPTLCYQLFYPRNTSIRPVWLAKRVAEYIIILVLEFVLWAQYY